MRGHWRDVRERARRLVIGYLTEEMESDVQSLGARPADLDNALAKCRQQALRVEQCRLRQGHGKKTPHPEAGVDEGDGDGTVEGVGDGPSAGAPEHGSAPVSLM